MKIRLINPPQLDEKGEPVKYRKLFIPTLTMPTIAGLTPPDIEVAITDGFIDDIDFDEKADLIGVTAQTNQAVSAYKIGDNFRKRGIKTIMGGIHASFNTDEALRHFDSVLVGEAEDMWEIICRDAQQNMLKRVYKAECFPDLSKPAIPRFDLLDYNNYILPPFAKTPLIPIMATKGCVFNCDFCVVHKFLGQKIRKKPVENVIKEIETIKPSRIFFVDDNFAADRDYTKELLKALKLLKLRWACQMSTSIRFHQDIIELCADAGCHENFMGIESVDVENLKNMHKGFNKVEEYKEMFRKLKEVGILAQVSMIFGLDNDNIDSLRRTIDTILEWDINYLYIFILTPIPGTEMFNKFKNENRIVDYDWSKYDGIHVNYKTGQISQDDLFDMYWQAYERFYGLKEIFNRLWRFRREYIKFFPRDLAYEELFFQLNCHKAISRHQHPFSLGMKIQK